MYRYSVWMSVSCVCVGVYSLCVFVLVQVKQKLRITIFKSIKRITLCYTGLQRVFDSLYMLNKLSL